MYARGGLPRAERELGALAASIVNHCVYCAAVHANRFISTGQAPEVVEVDLPRRGGREARRARPGDLRLRREADSRRPDAVGAADLAALRAVGLSDLEILDLIHAVAIFGWANRLMHTLGEPHRKA